MASEIGDPFDGRSPPAFHADDDSNYQDMNGRYDLTYAWDAPLPDLMDLCNPKAPPAQIISSTPGQVGSSTMMQDGIADFTLTESEQSDRISSLLNNGSENGEAPITDPEKAKPSNNSNNGADDTDVAIKEEEPDVKFVWDRFIADEVIELSDTEDVERKKEEDVYEFTWASKPDEDKPSSICDSDEEQGEYVVLKDGTRMPLKEENPDVEFSWSKMDDRVINLDSDEEPVTATRLKLGHPLLGKKITRPKHTPEEIKRMQRQIQMYCENHRAKQSNSRSQPLPKTPQLDPLQPNPKANDDDRLVWMSSDHRTGEDTGRKFKELKRSYKAKLKAGTNTLEDDVDFKRGEQAEHIRLERLKAEYEELRGSSESESSDEEEGAEESIFVTPPPSSALGSKRRMDTLDKPNGKQDSITGALRAKKRKIVEQAYFDPDQEYNANMIAGIEEVIGKRFRNSKTDKVAAKSKNSKEKTPSGATGDPKTPRRKKNKYGAITNIGSLLSTSLFDEATKANLERDALPISSEKKKAEALKSLIANAPLENRGEAQSQKKRLEEATVSLMKHKVLPDGNGGWRLPGLIPSLHHHQVIGAAFMKQREEGSSHPIGGILADAMGLGKTLEIIATMIANKPRKKEKNRCTLIVCSPGLIVQWERELARHVESAVFPKILKHHTATRLCGVGAVSIMQTADIILTTYQEVAKSYPKPPPIPEEITDEKQLTEWWRSRWDEARDVLHKVEFYRVVLDESQAIRNHTTHTSIACRALEAKHRWALSGTPIMNNVEELYPYFKFLRVPFTATYIDFHDNYCVPGSKDCNDRLICMLGQFMLRRTHNDQILGTPIVKLPKYNFRNVDLKFNAVERKLYQLVYRKFVGELNQASAEGILEKHPGTGLCAFMRLRQMATHPFLAQKTLQTLFEPEHVNNLEQAIISETTHLNRAERDMIAALRRMIVAKGKVAKAAPKESQASQKEPSNMLVAKFGQYLQGLKADSKWVKLKNSVLCNICGDPPEDPMVTSCLHLYCKECLQRMAWEASANDQDQTPCLKCGTTFTESQPCEGLKELSFHDAKLKLLEEAAEKDQKGKIIMDWVSYDNTLILSAKTQAVRNQVETWLRDEPDKKIIIFSQFHMIMQILEQVCKRKEWKFCIYNGHMSHKARDKTITHFANDPDMKIMIASLKCGAIGLNLTMASKVICIDLWFNTAVEEQAFCRVFRIGQESETFITRFVVQNSADDMLQEMQVRKDALISHAMNDRRALSALSVEDLMRLFGDVKVDKNKRPFIAMDDDEKLDSILK